MGNALHIESAPLHNQKRNRALRRACERVVRMDRLGLESLEARQLLSLPAGWATQDVVGPNSAAMAGSADYADGTFTVRGSGGDIWNQGDEFRFVYQTLNGDGEIIARLDAFKGVTPEGAAQNGWAKAGVMLRASLEAGAVHASTLMAPNTTDQVLQFARRTATNGGSSDTSEAGYYPSLKIKMARVGNTFTASWYDDYNETWMPVVDGEGNPVSYTINVPNQMYAGLAVTAHDNNRIDEGTFTEVQVISTPDTDAPGAPISVWAMGAADGKSIVVNWLDNASNETGLVLQRSTNPNFSGAITIELPADTYTYTDTAVTEGVTYYYRLQAVNAKGTSDWSNSSFMEAGMVSGLTATFFNANNTWFFNPNNNSSVYPALTRIDSNIDFNWGDPGSPGPGITEQYIPA
ncbi:MAG TPA: fibronectin type III domain-containing protein, partial [Tepidisphaeraceae bacterium]|nr:fibronectin type III domain-containing protein [Tepidisphaeraceae bacterium]